jgi:hypothetical protein
MHLPVVAVEEELVESVVGILRKMLEGAGSRRERKYSKVHMCFESVHKDLGALELMYGHKVPAEVVAVLLVEHMDWMLRFLLD